MTRANRLCSAWSLVFVWKRWSRNVECFVQKSQFSESEERLYVGGSVPRSKLCGTGRDG